MGIQPSIRKARAEDASQISALIFRAALCFNSSATGEIAPWFLASIKPATIAEIINDRDFNYLAGFVGPTLAGIIAVRGTTHIHHLFVAPEFHRRGIAGKLWDRARADALASGNREGFSVRSSEYAIPVYQRFGFRIVGDRTEKDGMAFVPMKLALQPEHD